MIRLLVLLSIITHCALSQLIIDSPSDVSNYTGDRQEIRDLFSGLWKRFNRYENVHCYRRAHVLANGMKSKDVTSAKAFVFFDGNMSGQTRWWHQVAPYILYKNKPVVLDRGLCDVPTFRTDLLDASSEGAGCKQFFSYDEYLNEKKDRNRPCMYLLAQMQYYGPNTLKEEMTSLNKSQLWDSIQSIPKRLRKKYLYKAPIKDLK
jgi:hypothetical protein